MKTPYNDLVTFIKLIHGRDLSPFHQRFVNRMYSFQEVHKRVPEGCRSQWDVVHDDTGIRCRYYGKTLPPKDFVWPYVMDIFYALTPAERVLNFVNGKKLPMKKIGLTEATDNKMTIEDFRKASDALKTANVPGPHWAVIPPIQGRTADIICIDDVIPNKTFQTQYYKDCMDACTEFFNMPITYKAQPISLGDCKPAPTREFIPIYDTMGRLVDYKVNNKEQGINPMAYDTKIASTAAVASIINAASDESKQRDFLMDEFSRIADRTWADPKYTMLRKMFNLDAPAFPMTSQGLLDAFKSGAFTVDQKKVDANAKFAEDGDDFDGERYDEDDSYIGERFFGITFTGLPVADRKGYETAVKEYDTFKKSVKRKIIVGTPAEGLAAIEALEAWMPTTPATATA